MHVKRGFPWAACCGVILCAIVGGGVLGIGVNAYRMRLAAPPDLAGTMLAGEDVEIGPDAEASAPDAPSRAGEYAKYKAVTDTLQQCRQTLRDQRFQTRMTLYRTANKARADAVYDDYAAQLSKRYDQAHDKTSKFAERGKTDMGILTMLVDGTHADMVGEVASLMSEFEGGFDDTGLIRAPNQAECDDFAKRVSYGEFDLAYF